MKKGGGGHGTPWPVTLWLGIKLCQQTKDFSPIQSFSLPSLLTLPDCNDINKHDHPSGHWADNLSSFTYIYKETRAKSGSIAMDYNTPAVLQ